MDSNRILFHKSSSHLYNKPIMKNNQTNQNGSDSFKLELGPSSCSTSKRTEFLKFPDLNALPSSNYCWSDSVSVDRSLGPDSTSVNPEKEEVLKLLRFRNQVETNGLSPSLSSNPIIPEKTEAMKSPHLKKQVENNGSCSNQCGSDSDPLDLSLGMVYSSEEPITRNITKRNLVCPDFSGIACESTNSELMRLKKGKMKQTESTLELMSSSSFSKRLQSPSSSSSYYSDKEVNSTLERVSGNVETQLLNNGNTNLVQPTIQRKLIIQKILTSSDVGGYNRLVIRKCDAIKYFPPLDEENPVKEILSFSDSQNVVWKMTYEYWKTSKNYALTTGWKHYVNKYNMRVGDEIRIYEINNNEADKRQFEMDHYRKPDNRVLLFGHELCEVQKYDPEKYHPNGGRRRIRKPTNKTLIPK